jgi:hypothetical protein
MMQRPRDLRKLRQQAWLLQPLLLDSGAYAAALSERGNSFLRLLKNKGFRDERRTKVELYAIGKSTTLESNKSLPGKHRNMEESLAEHASLLSVNQGEGGWLSSGYMQVLSSPQEERA